MIHVLCRHKLAANVTVTIDRNICPSSLNYSLTCSLCNLQLDSDINDAMYRCAISVAFHLHDVTLTILL